MSFDDDWEEIDVPRGAFIGWGQKPGQHVTGEVLEYDPDGGTDFGKKPCPRLSVILTEKAASFNKKGERRDYDPDTLVLINCGQVSLKRAVQAARLGPGDMVRLKLKDMVDLDDGKTVKEFGIQVKRGTGALSSNAERALAKSKDAPADDFAKDNQDDEPPF